MNKRILIAPLNWGLGHTTRCIPIINELIEREFEPVIASDGNALSLLKKEFPKLIHLELPSYNIEYPKQGQSLKWKLFKEIPEFLKTLKAEKEITKHIIENYKIEGIISDNRFGIYSNDIPSVYITHQLQVLSTNTTWFTSKMHQHIIKKFDECWVPDSENPFNYSGRLGHLDHRKHKLTLKYIGLLSRFDKKKEALAFDLMVLLSGPEPQRTYLEQKLMLELQDYKGKILFVKGLVEERQTITTKKQFSIYNFMQSHQLEKAINQSRLILARSGYTTIMDLAKLNKKAFFIPTPGQFEQEYLAKRLKHLDMAPYCEQENFTVDRLKEIDNYKGLNIITNTVDFKTLFSLF